jgi:hypothetical protein
MYTSIEIRLITRLLSSCMWKNISSRVVAAKNMYNYGEQWFAHLNLEMHRTWTVCIYCMTFDRSMQRIHKTTRSTQSKRTKETDKQRTHEKYIGYSYFNSDDLATYLRVLRFDEHPASSMIGHVYDRMLSETIEKIVVRKQSMLSWAVFYIEKMKLLKRKKVTRRRKNKRKKTHTRTHNYLSIKRASIQSIN